MSKNSDVKTQTTSGSAGADGPPEWLSVVRAQVESLKFGTVHISVHDSRVVQIERVEKTRFDGLQKNS